MFARSVLRSAARQSFKPATTSIPRASFHAAARLQTPPEEVQERQVPVTSWKDGARSQETLQVSETAPVTPEVGDAEIKAIPLNPEIIPQLTPTMAKFCLPGKVAVVTG